MQTVTKLEPPWTRVAPPLSHKLLTPLTEILSNGHLLNQTSLTINQKKLLSNILKSACEILADEKKIDTIINKTCNRKINKERLYQEKKLHILLVEDNQILIRAHKQLLEHAGYIVDVAEDGEKALLMGQSLYDLILMDIGLPYLNGFKVTNKLRQLGIKTPIIGLTAYIKNDVEKDCLVAGMNTVLNKPIEGEKIKKIIESYIFYRN